MNPITVRPRVDLMKMNLCRTCLSLSNNLKPIFMDKNDGDDICEMLQLCSGLTIYARDGMPASICPDCLNKLHNAYDFRRQCNTSHNALLRFMKTKTACKPSNVNKTQPALLQVNIKSECADERSNQENKGLIEKENLDAAKINKTEGDDVEYLDMITIGHNVPFINYKVGYEGKIEQSSNVSIFRDEREIFDEIADPFTSLKNLHMEMEALETVEEVEDWTCFFDPQKLTSKREHSDHAEAHSKNGPNQETAEVEEWICTLCPRKFNSKQEHTDHLKMHSKTRPCHEIVEAKEWTCTACPKKFNSNQECSDHVKTYLKNKPYECDDCDSVKLSPKLCEICGESFISIKQLNLHRKEHHSIRYECYFCQKEFNSTEERTDHMKAHEKELLFLCCECGLQFGRKGDLDIHMLRHSSENKYECKYCDQMFVRPSELTMHERSHTGEKKYLTNCKSFPRPYSLSIHNRVHTEERPLKYSQCDKSFARKDDFTAHIQQRTAELFVCDLCDDFFNHSSLLSQHKRRKHGLKSQQLKNVKSE